MNAQQKARVRRRSLEGFKVETEVVGILNALLPKGYRAVPSKRNRKAIDFWIITPEGKASPGQVKDTSSISPIRKHLRKSPNVAVVVRASRAKQLGLDSRNRKDG